MPEVENQHDIIPFRWAAVVAYLNIPVDISQTAIDLSQDTVANLLSSAVQLALEITFTWPLKIQETNI